MTKYFSNTLNLILFVLLFGSCQAQTSKDSGNQNGLQDVQQSHLDGNIPDKSSFDSLLKRDLEKYFSSSYGPVTVTWEFLRDGPTQSGVSYPKYYLWAQVSNAQKKISEGAVRVAAMNRTVFGVTDYVDINQIKTKSVDIYSIFPGAVCEKILTHVK